MKNRTIIMVVVILLVVAAASAQSTDPINFRTPFDFLIGDKVVPAGDYTVRVMSSNGRTLLFRSPDGKTSVLIGSSVVYQGDAANCSKVIFHRYGVHYYISEIWTLGYKTGRTISARAGELQLAKNEKPQIVTLYLDRAEK